MASIRQYESESTMTLEEYKRVRGERDKDVPARAVPNAHRTSGGGER